MQIWTEFIYLWWLLLYQRFNSISGRRRCWFMCYPLCSLLIFFGWGKKKVWQRRPFSWSGNEACCFRCGGWGALLSGLVILCEQNNGAIVIFLSFPPLDFPDSCIIFHSLWRGANLFGRILLSPPPPANCMGTQSFKAVQSHLGGYMYVGLHMHTDDSYSALSTWANMRNEKWSYRKFENAPCRKQRESWCVIVVIFFNLLFYLVHLW